MRPVAGWPCVPTIVAAHGHAAQCRRGPWQSACRGLAFRRSSLSLPFNGGVALTSRVIDVQPPAAALGRARQDSVATLQVHCADQMQRQGSAGWAFQQPRPVVCSMPAWLAGSAIRQLQRPGWLGSDPACRLAAIGPAGLDASDARRWRPASLATGANRSCRCRSPIPEAVLPMDASTQDIDDAVESLLIAHAMQHSFGRGLY